MGTPLPSERFASPTELSPLVHKPWHESVENGLSPAESHIDGLSTVVARPGKFRVGYFVPVDY
jgi:hypothetical protein